MENVCFAQRLNEIVLANPINATCISTYDVTWITSQHVQGLEYDVKTMPIVTFVLVCHNIRTLGSVAMSSI